MTAPHDRPTMVELVEAVREFLESDVAGATTGRVHFHARVAANVLSMVERELALGDELRDRHSARLGGLGFGSDAELARAIREGDLDDQYDIVRDALLDGVKDKLRVANPGYLDE